MLLECPVSGDEITRKIAGGFGQQEFAFYDVLRAIRRFVRLFRRCQALTRFFLSVAQASNVVNKAMADAGIRDHKELWGSRRRLLEFNVDVFAATHNSSCSR